MGIRLESTILFCFLLVLLSSLGRRRRRQQRHRQWWWWRRQFEPTADEQQRPAQLGLSGRGGFQGELEEPCQTIFGHLPHRQHEPHQPAESQWRRRAGTVEPLWDLENWRGEPEGPVRERQGAEQRHVALGEGLDQRLGIGVECYGHDVEKPVCYARWRKRR